MFVSESIDRTQNMALSERDEHNQSRIKVLEKEIDQIREEKTKLNNQLNETISTLERECAQG